MKIITVVGARPQFIKLAPVDRLFLQFGFDHIVIHTGQHYDYMMSDIFFEELGIKKPHYNLEIGSGSHACQTAGMLEGLEPLFIEHNPDWLLIYGDTNSTLSAALVAAKLCIPIIHVEAGLRSFNRSMPEEINRIVADSLSTLLFAPTRQAEINLHREGVSSHNIKLVGDVMYDSAIYFSQRAESISNILDRLSIGNNEYLLVTIHRAENTENLGRLKNIVQAICELSKLYKIIWPIHPRTLSSLRRNCIFNALNDSTVQLIDPVGYLDMIKLEKGSKLIITDSGGVQKEAFFYKRPCITLRHETEWVELVELGWNTICPPISTREIIDTVLSKIDSCGDNGNPYGNGDASYLIASGISNYSFEPCLTDTNPQVA